MRILMVLESDFPPDVRVENEAISLLKAGHEVHIACYSRNTETKKTEWEGIKIHRKAISAFIYKSSVGALRLPFYFNFWRKFLNDILNSTQFECIHIHDLPLAKIGYEMKMKYKIKFTLDLHENWPALLALSEHTKSLLGRILSTDNQWKNYERKYTALADQVIVVVDEAKHRISKLGIDSAKIIIVSNTLNLDEFHFPKPKTDQNKIILVYGGGVNYHRGLQYVIEALTMIKSSIDLNFWIIGDGRYLFKLKEQAQRLEVHDKITFWGWQPRQKLLKLISQSNIALIPHMKSPHTDNTIPHKLFQYMYAEIPIISSNCVPLNRIIKETNSGDVFESGNPTDLAKLLDDLIENPKKLENFKKGKKWVEEKYNWALDEKSLVEIYK